MYPFPKFKVAAIQASPVFLNKEATLKKSCSLIDEASKNGAELIVFPEAYIPTYPYWLPEGPGLLGEWAYSWRDLLVNSVEIPGPDVAILCEAARKANAYIVMGVNERDIRSQGTIYNTMLFIGRTGHLLGAHRKLVPTLHERMYWGQGDGSGLNVYETDFGGLSGLICAENLMTLSKYALFAQGEQIHCMTFPGWGGTRLPNEKGEPNGSIIDVIAPSLAREGQVWVVVSCGYLTESDVPDDFPHKGTIDFGLFGGSGIVSPRGNYIAGPIYGKEAIVYGDIDIGDIALAKCAVDSIGHYARWDVSNINLNKTQYLPFSDALSTKNLSDNVPDLKSLQAVLKELDDNVEDGTSPGILLAIEKLRQNIGFLKE
jgi:aliphatic nitrilase